MLDTGTGIAGPSDRRWAIDHVPHPVHALEHSEQLQHQRNDRPQQRHHLSPVLRNPQRPHGDLKAADLHGERPPQSARWQRIGEEGRNSRGGLLLNLLGPEQPHRGARCDLLVGTAMSVLLIGCPTGLTVPCAILELALSLRLMGGPVQLQRRPPLHDLADLGRHD